MSFPAVLLPAPASKAADGSHYCVPQDRSVGVCRRSVPGIPLYGTHVRDDFVDATITSNTGQEVETGHNDEAVRRLCWESRLIYSIS